MNVRSARFNSIQQFNVQFICTKNESEEYIPQM